MGYYGKFFLFRLLPSLFDPASAQETWEAIKTLPRIFRLLENFLEYILKNDRHPEGVRKWGSESHKKYFSQPERS